MIPSSTSSWAMSLALMIQRMTYLRCFERPAVLPFFAVDVACFGWLIPLLVSLFAAAPLNEMSAQKFGGRSGASQGACGFRTSSRAGV
jgi:cobalamin synthase